MENANLKILKIGFDAGFDGGKCIVNTRDYDIPITIVEINGDSEEQFSMMQVDENYMRLMYEDRVYLIGKKAREYMLSSLNSSTNNDSVAVNEVSQTMQRYETYIFEVTVNAVLAYSMYNYFLDMGIAERDMTEQLKEHKVGIGCALPHSFVEKLIPTMEKILKKPHSCKLSVGGREYVEFDFNVDYTYYNSQMKAMFYNEVTDDYGDYLLSNDNLYNKLPAIMIDGGYKTIADAVMNIGQTLDMADSNMTYAMFNVNEKVAANIKTMRDGIEGYLIDEIIASHMPVSYVDANGVAVKIDVEKEKEKVFEEYVSEYLDYLKKKYADLLNVNTILFGGGTGEEYYDKMQPELSQKRSFINLVKAGQKPFYGKVLGARFSIVCGIYKDFICWLNEEYGIER